MGVLNEKNICPWKDLLVAINNVFESLLDLLGCFGIDVDAIGVIRAKSQMKQDLEKTRLIMDNIGKCDTGGDLGIFFEIEVHRTVKI